MQKTIFAIIMTIVLIIGVTSTNAYATKKDPYESGFDHGCSDSHIEDASDRYINQPEKGPKYHTSDFMRGYYDGFKECGYDNGVLISNVDDHSNQQENNQAAYTTQEGQCGVVLIGDCNIGQSSTNKFASNNDN